MNARHSLSLTSQSVLFAISVMAASPLYAADNTVDLGTIGGAAGAGKTVDVFVNEGSAAAVSPSQSNLKIGEPQAIVSRAFIENSVAPTGDYFSIIAITPSVVTQPSPNGPGLSDGAKATLRGFQDGQYNITFDGIPFGDTNDPTHHSISYFPAQVIGGVVVERGPGNASNLGQATFGGTVALLSKTPLAEQKTTLYGSFGTWNTRLGGVAYESGRMKDLGDATLQLNFQNLDSAGYQSFANIKNQDFLAKFQRAVGESTLMTVFGTFNDLNSNLPDSVNGPTVAQVAAFGKNYLLNADPTSQGFYAYNTVHKQSDMEYLRFQSDWGNGFETDNNTYTYAYNNKTMAGCDTSVYPLPSTNPAKGCDGELAAGTFPANGIAGYDKLNQYRVWGDIFKATQQTRYGLARFGIWLEHADTERHNLSADVSNGLNTLGTPALIAAAGAGGKFPKAFIQNSSWNQEQPFAEFEWAAAEGLTVTPGLKYVHFVRGVDAQANQGKGGQQTYGATFQDRLPFLTVTQLLGSHDSVYAQFAKGFLVPALSTLQNSDVPAKDSDPQHTRNYQLGVVHKDDGFTADADIYYIDFDNQQGPLPGLVPTTYGNIGGTVYKGFEAEATYVFGYGLTGYLNGAINTATYKTGNINGYYGQVANAPKNNIGAGLIFAQGPYKASLIIKHIGDQYAAPDETFKIDAYNTADLNASYTLVLPNSTFKQVITQVSVFNVANRQALTSITPAGNTPSPADQVTYQAPRSYMLSVKADF